MSEVAKTYNDKVDELEAVLVRALEEGKVTPHGCQWKHIFTPGLYTRQIFMPAGHIISSEIHRTEHPYIVLTGKVAVMTETGTTYIEAPFVGVTKPDPEVRRILMVEEDCIWVTFHPTDKTTVEDVADDILVKHTNPFIQNEKRVYGESRTQDFSLKTNKLCRGLPLP